MKTTTPYTYGEVEKILDYPNDLHTLSKEMGRKKTALVIVHTLADRYKHGGTGMTKNLRNHFKTYLQTHNNELKQREVIVDPSVALNKAVSHELLDSEDALFNKVNDSFEELKHQVVSLAKAVILKKHAALQKEVTDLREWKRITEIELKTLRELKANAQKSNLGSMLRRNIPFVTEREA